MKPLLDPQHAAQLGALCATWGIERLEVFGSAARGDLRPDSDVDLLATFAGDRHYDAFALMDLQDELAALFGRPVDLLTRRAVERSRNPLRRQQILAEVEVLVGA